MASIGPAFFLVIAIFNFVLQIRSLVTEKELKLRQVRMQYNYFLCVCVFTMSACFIILFLLNHLKSCSNRRKHDFKQIFNILYQVEELILNLTVFTLEAWIKKLY